MPDLKISQLPPVLTATTNDLLVVVNGGVTKRVTVGDILGLGGLTADTNTYITGATYTSSGGTLELQRNDAVTIQVSGFTSMSTLNLSPLSTPPTGTTHNIGDTGDVIMGTDDNLYAKTSSGWLRFSGTTF